MSKKLLKKENLKHLSQVTIIVLAHQLDLDVTECLDIAYEEIKNRNGKMVNGTFVKEEDL